MFKAVDAVLFDQGPHVAMNRIVPPCNGHMKTVIRYGFLGPFTPLLIRLHEILLGRRYHKINDHRGAAHQSGGRTGEKIFTGHGSHKGQLHVGVGIDAPRHYILPPGIYFPAAAGFVDIFGNGRDFTVGAQYIRGHGLVGGDNSSPFDQDAHICLLVYINEKYQ